MSGRVLPCREGVVCDHMACVRMCTKSSINEMIIPGVIAVFTPISVGLLVGGKCLGGLLAGSIASGMGEGGTPPLTLSLFHSFTLLYHSTRDCLMIKYPVHN